MTSIVFSAPRHLEPDSVITLAPGYLIVANRPTGLDKGNYVYVCHRGAILYRAEWVQHLWLDERVTVDGVNKGPGWVVEVKAPETSPRDIPFKGTKGFAYIRRDELW